MKFLSACCLGAAAWCSLGTVGLADASPGDARLALLPPWWWLPPLALTALAGLHVARIDRAHLPPLLFSTIAVLPWLPLPLPPAALLWTGPFVWSVWAAVAVGAVASRAGGALKWGGDSRQAAIVALAVYLFSAWWLSPILPQGDEPHYLTITQSLLKDGDLRIENNHARGDYLEYSLHTARPDYLRRGVNGEIYSIHAPGLPAIVAPAFFVGGYGGVITFLALVSALATGLVWRLAYRVTMSPAAAWFGWACAGLTAPFVFLATESFPDGVAAICLLFGCMPFVEPGGDARSNLRWLVAGIALGVLPWLQTRLVVLAVAAAACLVARARRARQLQLLAAPAFVSACAWFGFFYIVYGTPNPSAPYGHYTQMSVANLARGVPGTLFDQQFGLIANAPIYGVVLAGVIAAAMRLQRWAWELLVLVVPYTAAVGMYAMWWGGASPPARFMTPLVLVLGVGAARVWHAARAPATRALGVATLVASVLIAVALGGPDRGRLLVNFRDGIALWLEWGSSILDLPNGAPSLFRGSLRDAWLKAGAWGVSFSVVWLALRVLTVGAASAARRLSWAAPWCGALGVMAAFSASWAIDGRRPLTPDTGGLAIVRALSPRAHAAYDFRSHRFLTPADALPAIRLRSSSRRPASREPAPLLSIQHVPAGTYRIHTIFAKEASGTVSLRVGETFPLPLSAWRVDDRAAHDVRVPVAVRSFVVDGDANALQSVGAVELEATARAVSTPVQGAAFRAVQYGSSRVYFMDENAFPEPQGFWVAGGRTARLIIAAENRPQELLVRNSPVENLVNLEVDGVHHEIRLAPGEETLIPLQRAPGGDAVLVVESSRGFRPSREDPANGDSRYLGCWLELR
jgi:hypothetical protein